MNQLLNMVCAHHAAPYFSKHYLPNLMRRRIKIVETINEHYFDMLKKIELTTTHDLLKHVRKYNYGEFITLLCELSFIETEIRLLNSAIYDDDYIKIKTKSLIF